MDSDISQKRLWQHLAKKNSRYFINSDKGKSITETQFRKSGKEDYKKHVFDDEIVSKTGVIIDLGCGTGRMTEFMAKDFKTVIGVDISKEMLKQARERLDGIKNILFLETDGESIPLAGSSIDTVFSYLVFQHIKEKEVIEKYFKNIYKILKPGGLFKVRLRTDEIENMDQWWSGVNYSEVEARVLGINSGFEIIKTQLVEHYGVWLWLLKK